MSRLLVFASLLAICSVGTAQQPSPSAPANGVSPAPHTFLLTVKSKKEHVPSLSAGDLEVKEDGKPSAVLDVKMLGEVPLHYCLVFDTSNSGQDQFKLQQAEAIELLQKVIKAGTDTGWLVRFDNEPRPGPETNVPGDVVNSIAQMRPGGATALYDAMTNCADRMEKTVVTTGLRAMFVFSDGGDNVSRVSREETLQSMLRAHLTVYAMGPNILTALGVRNLERFAKETGGRAYFPDGAKEAKKNLAEIASELANVFVVTYESPVPNGAGQLHKLEVRCLKKGMSVSAPGQYYAAAP